jgi:hypothetical protein
MLVRIFSRASVSRPAPSNLASQARAACAPTSAREGFVCWGFGVAVEAFDGIAQGGMAVARPPGRAPSERGRRSSARGHKARHAAGHCPADTHHGMTAHPVRQPGHQAAEGGKPWRDETRTQPRPAGDHAGRALALRSRHGPSAWTTTPRWAPRRPLSLPEREISGEEPDQQRPGNVGEHSHPVTARSRSSSGCGFLDAMNPNLPRGHSLQDIPRSLGNRGGPRPIA